MKTQSQFAIGKNNIKYIGDNFKECFYDMKFELPKHKSELTFKTLEKQMTDQEILSEFKPQEIVLGDVLNAIKTNKDMLKNSYANIFYIKDKNDVLRAVSVRWFDCHGRWRVVADDVEDPHRWDGGHRVFSRNFGYSDTKSKDRQMTLQQLINSIKFCYVNPDITEIKFPAQETRGKVELLSFGKNISSEDAIKEMSERGYEPANLYELLTFAKQNWNGKDYVIALGSVWRGLGGGRCVACLWGGSAGRRLGLGWFGGDWGAGYRFAAVRKVASGKLETSLPLETLPNELIINGVKYKQIK